MSYEPTDNFHSRLSVVTTYKDKVIDHRGKEFRDLEYSRNSQQNPPQNPKGIQMNSVTEVPARKRARSKAKAATTDQQDQKLKEALDKDLQKRNVRKSSK